MNASAERRSPHERGACPRRSRPAASFIPTRLGAFRRSAVAALLAAAALPAGAEDFSVMFGRGSGETRTVQFDEFEGDETWFMTRCQTDATPDYYILIREYGEVERIKPVNSAQEADKTVCIIGHIPDIVKRYMR